MKFKQLEPQDIDVRVGTAKQSGISLLLYKDARCDMNILDDSDVIWQRDHKELKGNIYCGVSIWNEEIKQWITKWDVGSESNTEAVKGEASDSFKRACFNWGIGRELYTSPFIWVTKANIKESGRKDKYNKPIYTCYDKFEVKEIGYDSKGNINKLTIFNKTLKLIAYELGKFIKPEIIPTETTTASTPKKETLEMAKTMDIVLKDVAKWKNCTVEQITDEQLSEAIHLKVEQKTKETNATVTTKSYGG